MSLLTKNNEQIQFIISDIEQQLRNRETFGRANAWDHGDKAEIVGFLTVVPSYAYVKIDVTEDDLVDPKNVADEFVHEWCKSDNPEDVRLFKRFIEDGNRWGWD